MTIRAVRSSEVRGKLEAASLMIVAGMPQRAAAA